MDALPEFLHLIGMALGALRRRQLRRCGHFVVIAVAGLTGPVAIHHRASMHALFVQFHGMREWNLVAREKLLIAVTGGASIRQIFLGYG